MNESERAALLKIGEREEWAVVDLPREIDAEVLRSLDKTGYVEARRSEHSFSPAPDPVQRAWHSPIGRDPSAPGVPLDGRWVQIRLADLICFTDERGVRRYVCEWFVRLSDEGRKELERQIQDKLRPMASRPVAFGEEEWVVLMHLARNPKSKLSAARLAKLKGGPRGEKAVRAVLRKAHEAELVHYPKHCKLGAQALGPLLRIANDEGGATK